MDMGILVVAGVVSRLVPHLPNMTSVGAGAILAGKRLKFPEALTYLLVTMLATDLVFGFHAAMWAVYVSFVVSIVLGKTVGRSGRFGLGTAAIAGSTVFYLLTNGAVWMAPVSLYPKNGAGLVACMIAGLPFFRNTLIGDLVYLTVLSAVFRILPILDREIRHRPTSSLFARMKVW